MAAALLCHQCPRRLEGKRRLVHPRRDQGIEHVGDGHQARRHWNGIAGQLVGVAGTVPFFMVPVGDFLGQGQKLKRLLDVLLGQFDRVTAQLGVGLHDGPLRCGELARLVQNVVGNTDFADVVHGGRSGQQADETGCQGGLKTRMVFQQVRQQCHVALGTRQMFASFGVPRFSQMRQGADADLLGQVVLKHATGHLGLECGIFVPEPVPGLLGQ